MIVNDKGDFSGSVSGGCVESAVVQRMCRTNYRKKTNHLKKLNLKFQTKVLGKLGLACGGEIAVYLEQIN